MEKNHPRPVALVFAGGNALGAYSAGAFAAFDRAGGKPYWLAGSSVGAINAAIVAGNKPENRVSVLREYWRRASLPDGPWDIPIASWSRSFHLASSVQTRLLGRPAILSPRLSLPGSARNPEQASLYDFTPLRRTLGELIDFERLNGGDMRLSIMTVDIESGEEVVFDTSRERILLDHVLASAGLIPDFPAREIGGRWLGDGALSANAPVGIVLSEPQDGLICFLIDSFPRNAPRPTSWFEASERRRDLIIRQPDPENARGCLRFDQLGRSVREAILAMPGELRSRKELVALAGILKQTAVDVVCMEYRAEPDELGMKWFDFSTSAIGRRWLAGETGMKNALETLSNLQPGQGLRIHGR